MYRLWASLSVTLLIAALCAGCGSGNNSPSMVPASGSSTPAQQPTITLTPSTTVITAGQGVTLTWNASSAATSVTSSNFGATALTGTVTLFPTTPITYTITVNGSGGNATATVAVAVNAPPTTPSAVSGFGTAAYSPGTGFPVQISVTPTTTTQSYTVQDTLPAGWTATAANNNGSAVNNQVNWGPLTGTTPIVLSYTAVPPANAGGTATFTGTATFDTTNTINISGDRSLGNKSRGR